VSTLRLKRRRDVGKQRGQFAAVLVTVVIGVAMFAGTFNAYLNLGASLDGTYDRLRMADMTVADADDGFIDTAASITGVDDVAERQVADVPMAAGEFTFVGRMIGIPAGPGPTINQFDVDEGQDLDSDDPSGVLLETHAASDFDLDVGDTFEILGQEVTVRGIVTSPEYLWPAQDRQNIFTAPKSFGVAFVSDEWFTVLDGETVSNEVLIVYDDGADTESVDADVSAAARAASAGDIQALADQPSNATVNLEITALQTMAVALPVLFLTAAGMAIYVVIARLVYSQRAVIGTLRASGFSSRQMAAHYRSFGLAVGLIGAAIGSLLGGLMARGMTAIYTAVFGIPDLVASFHLPTVLMALSFGAVAGLLAAVAPARAVAKLPPAEAMRGDLTPADGRRSIFETLIPPLRRAPVRWLMSLRGIGRNKKRSASMIGGVMLGMVLIMGAWGMLDTMLASFDRQFNEVAIEDSTVAFVEPVTDETIESVEAVEGVAVAEPVVGLRATVVNGGESYTTLLEAYRPDTQVHGFDPELPPSGTLLGEAMRDLLDVSAGDVVTLQLPDLEIDLTVEVAGFVDEPMTTMAYLSSDALDTAVDAAGVDSSTLSGPAFTTVRTIFDGEREVTIAALRDLDGVAAVVDSSEIRDLIESFQVFFYLFVGFMLLFGGAMAFALIFNIISVNVSERRSEFASMRANGLSHRRVARLIVGETCLLTAIGIVPGLVAGYVAAVAFVNTFASDQFPISAQLRWFVYVGTIAAMFIVAALSLLPAIRAVKRIDVAAVVRERST